MRKLMIKFASEITLKGLNKKFFENQLIKNIKLRIGEGINYEKQTGRIYLDDYSDEIIDKVTKVYGITSVAIVDVVEKDIASIEEAALSQMIGSGYKTFKVEAKRVDKSFELGSMDIKKHIGGVILKNVEDIKVDVHNPDVVINIEIRDMAYVYSKEIKGVGGMPYKTAGKGVLLLSGGIDSPVAGYMMGKRGLEIVSVYFHSHPYTSERAKEKVVELAKKLTTYTDSMKLYIVPFTKIQMEIIEKCKEDELTIIMRRYMMKIAEEIAKKEEALALITGESLGQVASQTLESMLVTNSVVSIPVFRPLVGMDKIDIMDISRKIDTYEISILPYEDCCTIFVPKHPKTRPRLEEIEQSEAVLNSEELVKDAMENIEIVRVKLGEE